MPDKSYWKDRQEKKYLAGEKKINQYYKDLEKSFEQAKKEIQKVINDFVTRYAIENEVNGKFATVQRKLNKTEIGDLQSFIDLANANMGKYNQELNNMSYKARITRYQALEKQIDATLQQLYAIDYQYKGEELLKEVYSDSYYQTWFNTDIYHGFHAEFAQVNAQTVEELIKYPFNGANFSTRLWKQKEHMLQQLNESITTMLIQGRNPMTLSKDFAKKFGTKEFEAYRLLHTEGSFMMGQGTLAAYKEDGVEQYQILATLDTKTSDICREQDEKIYDVDKAVVGVNEPPFHAFCRSTTTPFYDDADYSGDTRIARDPVTGKSYEVPTDMDYKDWHKKYIENNPEAVIAEKKWTNRFNDMKQYARYTEVLDKDAPKTLDDFQNLKYNDIDKWNDIKGYYSYKYNNPLSSKTYYDIDKDIKELINKGLVSDTIGTAVKPVRIDFESIHKHASKRMQQRNITEKEAKEYIAKSAVMFKQRSGQKNVYYSMEGVATVVTDEKLLVTVFSKSDYDDGARAIMEVLKKHGK